MEGELRSSSATEEEVMQIGDSEEEEEQVMSEVHLGCPLGLSAPHISHFTISVPPEGEHIGSRYNDLIRGKEASTVQVISVDEDDDLVLPRRSELSSHGCGVAIQHSVTSSIPRVGLQVWRAELVLADFVLHKMLTSSEFNGIVSLELGSGTEMAPSFASSSELSKNVKFVNKLCRCGLKCSVKISESRDNPNRLYFCFPLNKCGYFEWWEVPEDLHESGVMGADCCGLSHYEKNADEKWKDVMNELRVLNLKMKGLVIFCVCLLIIVLLK